MLIASVLVVLTSVFGWYSENDEKPRWIFLYSFLLVICIGLQAISSFIIYDSSNEVGLQVVKNGMIATFNSQPGHVKDIIQKVQNENFCCGVDGKAGRTAFKPLNFLVCPTF